MEKLRAKIIVTVTETKDQVDTQVAGIVKPKLDTMDRADIAFHVIKSLGITVTDVVIWWIANSEEKEDAQ